jgi:heme-degrading monooxygenase HmoA
MASDDAVVFINIFDVEPSNQDELIKVLSEGADRAIRHRPGFVSMTLLASKDKTRVVNYASWRSVDDAKATQADPDAQEYAKRAAELATASPNVFAVVGQYEA